MSNSHERSHDIIGLAMDPAHSAVTSRSLNKTMRRLHGGQRATQVAPVAPSTGPTIALSGDSVVTASENTASSAVAVSVVTHVPKDATKGMEDMLDSDTKMMYRRPWNKLEVGLKWDRLKIYTDAFALANKLSDSEKALLATGLRRALDAKYLNTKAQMDYNPDTERIVTIYGLHELPKNATGDRRFGLVPRSRATRKRPVASKTPATTQSTSTTAAPSS